MKRDEINKDLRSLLESKNFTVDLKNLIKKYESQKGRKYTIKFDVLQGYIEEVKEKNPAVSFSRLSILAASLYNVKEGRSINPAHFVKWVDKGLIKMPARKIKVVESKPDGGSL